MSRWNDGDGDSSSEQPHIFAPFSPIESSQARLATHYKHASLDSSYLDLESDADTDADTTTLPCSTVTTTTLSDSTASAPAQHALWLDTGGGGTCIASSSSEPTHGTLGDHDDHDSAPTTRRVHPGFDPLQQHVNQFLFDPLRLSSDIDPSGPQWKEIDFLGVDTPPLTPHTPFSWQSAAPFALRASSVVGSSSSPSPPESPMTPPHPDGLQHGFSPVVGSPARRSSLPVQSVSTRSSLAGFQASPSHFGADRSEALVSALSNCSRSTVPKQSTCSAPGTPGGALSSLIDDHTVLPDTNWGWPVPSKTTRAAAPRPRDPANSDSAPTALDLDALRLALPRVDGSSPTTDHFHWEDARFEPQAAQSSRYVRVSAAVSEEARAARLQEIIVKAKHISSYKGWCGTSTQGIIAVFHDVRGADEFVALIESLLKSSRVSACPISRKMFEEMLDADPMLEQGLLSPSEGVLAITCNAPSHLRESSVLTLLSSMGSLRSFSIVEVGIVLCEYNDDRSAETARRELNGRVHDGIRFQCTFEPTMTNAMNLYAFGRKGATSTGSWRSTSTPSTNLISRDSYTAPISPLAPSFVPLKSIGEGSTPRDTRAGSLAGPELFNRGRRHSEYNIGGSLARSDVTASESASHRRLSLASSSSVTSSSFPAASSTTAPASLPLTHGIYRDERIPRNNVIDLERIKQGLDLRTTLMLKNIPNKLKDVDVMKFIDESVGRCYQFLYIRLDWSSGCNVGYGFVDFNSASLEQVEDLARFVRARVGTRWNLANSDKICVGKAGLITHFRNSSVLDQDEERRPKLFYSPGHPLAGQPEPFPACDDPVRRARSAANAVNVGLFPSSRPTFKVAEARPTFKVAEARPTQI